MIQAEGVPLIGGLNAELKEYVPPNRQTTDPGRVAAAAPTNVLGDAGLPPEFWSRPEEESELLKVPELFVPHATSSAKISKPPQA
jgi:hypothetical protein